jgi:hypothetical protein
VFDAPEPCGPWTTVYYADRWNEGWTIHQRFHTKWMSGDGRTMWLVFSGRNVRPTDGNTGSILNCLVVRRATLVRER